MGEAGPACALPGHSRAVRTLRARRGTCLACPIRVDAKQTDKGDLLPNAKVVGSVVMWQWVGDDGATTSTY